MSFPDNLTLSLDGQFLYAAYRSTGGVFVFDVQKMLDTIEANRTSTTTTPAGVFPTLEVTPLDDLAVGPLGPVEIERIGTGGLPQGMETDADSAPAPIARIEVLPAHFFVDDEHEVTITLANDAIGETAKDFSNTVIFALTPEFPDEAALPDNRQFLDTTELDANRLIPLGPGDPEQGQPNQVTLKLPVTKFLKNIKDIEQDRLYGAKITIQAYQDEVKPGKEIGQAVTTFIYRLVDAADDDHEDGVVELADTLADGSGNIQRRRPLEIFAPDSALPTLELPDSFEQRKHFRVETDPSSEETVPLQYTWVFDPIDPGIDFETTVLVQTPDAEEAGRLTLRGDGEWVVYELDTVALENALAHVSLLPVFPPHATNLGVEISQAEKDLVDDNPLGELSMLVTDIVSRVNTLLMGFAVATSGVNPVLFERWDSTLGVLSSEVNQEATQRYPLPVPPVQAVQQYLWDEQQRGVASETDVQPDVVNFDDPTDTTTVVAQWRNNQISLAEAAFRLSEGLNENPGGIVEIFVDKYFEQVVIQQPDQVSNLLGKVIVHELGHHVGLVHTIGSRFGVAVSMNDNRAGLDVMANGDDLGGNLHITHLTEAAWRIGLGDQWALRQVQLSDGTIEQAVTDEDEVIKSALAYYALYVDAGGDFDVGGPIGGTTTTDPDAPSGPGQRGPFLIVQDVPNTLPGPVELDFGDVIVDGPGLTDQMRVLRLKNTGGQDVIIRGIDMLGDTNWFALGAIQPNERIAPNESLLLSVTFDPVMSGSSQFELIIRSNGGDPRIPVTGFGRSIGSDISVEPANTNLGGVGLGDPPKEVGEMASIINIGSQPLSIFDVRMVGGDQQFAVSGLPAKPSRESPLVLQPNESQTIGLLFDVKQLGLQSAEVQIFSDDPDIPVFSLPVMGTGLTDVDAQGLFKTAVKLGNDQVAFEIRGDSSVPVQRVISDADGQFEFSATPGLRYHVVIFDADSGLVAHGFGDVGPDGKVTNAGFKGLFDASNKPDTDGNGTPDDIDFAVGSGAFQQSNLGTQATISAGFVAPASSPLIAPDPPVPRELGSDSVLDPQSSDLTPFIQAAESNWQTLDLSLAQASSLNGAQLVIADLPGSELAITTGDTITLDVDAGGHGWFIDSTPEDNEEYLPTSDAWAFEAITGSDAEDKIDLLTVMTHELGHVIGLEDVSPVSSPLILMTFVSNPR